MIWQSPAQRFHPSSQDTADAQSLNMAFGHEGGGRLPRANEMLATRDTGGGSWSC